MSHGTQATVREGGLLTVTEDQPETITCVTGHSNPAPSISWQLGDQVLPSIQQTNTSEADKWRSEAVLTHSFVKSDAGRQLRCVVRHAAYPAGERLVSASLDVLCRCLVLRGRSSGNNDNYCRQAYSEH